MKINLLLENKEIYLEAKKGENLLDVLTRNKIDIPTDCGKKGKCKKCAVRLISGSVDGTCRDDKGNILSCLSFIKEPITISIQEKHKYHQESHDSLKSVEAVNKNSTFGIAFDLGTTTLAFSLVDLEAKKVCERYTVLNKQSVYGADVITRISASNEGNLESLHKIVCEQLEEAIQYFIKKHGLKEIKRVVVAGNTTMLHLFLNVSPESIGVAPYNPIFLEHKKLSGSDINISCQTIDVLPSCSAFVGADITAGAYLINLPNNSLLVDLGTNGELLYHKDNKYFATSTAAGPCLEGASMDCGVGGIKGAVCKVSSSNSGVDFETVGNEEACGICGAGYVDLIASLLNSGKIDETGCLLENNDKYNLTEKIYISASDVRKFQLAKSAISSGIETLLKEIEVNKEDVENIFLAGGIGYYVNVKNAITVGLLPKSFNNKVHVVGNSSLFGAEKCFFDENAINDMRKIAENSSTIDLNTSKFFSDSYMMNMLFDLNS